ncbi:hypothetical protein BKA70DRAFT_1254794 [Coprinopsis sp. MPI-PUGE-AT-0042]|nr:hypothetical protein BKA70DRAFT_1254794 [Coprinopsis sp. MPI-PUGE-AT-0042]
MVHLPTERLSTPATSLTSTRLPLELLCEVVEHLDPEDDAKTLQATSVTAKVFRAPSQRALFEWICLGGPGTPSSGKPASRLLRIFSHSPSLASYVKQLSIYDYDSKDQDQSRWVMQDEDLPKIILLLRDLGNVRLFLCSFKSQLLNYWGCLPEATKTALSTMCSCPSLRELVTSSIPTSALLSFPPHLTELRLREAVEEISDVDSRPGQVTNDMVKTAPVLNTLETTVDEDFIRFLIGPARVLNLGQLDELQLLPAKRPHSSEGIAQLIEMCSSALTSLLVYAPVLTHFELNLFKLSHLKVLSIFMGEEDAHISSLGSVVYVALTTLPHPNCLEEVNVTSNRPFSSTFLHQDGMSDAGWELIDELLTTPERFPKFTSFSFDMEYAPPLTWMEKGAYEATFRNLA